SRVATASRAARGPHLPLGDDRRPGRDGEDPVVVGGRRGRQGVVPRRRSLRGAGSGGERGPHRLRDRRRASRRVLPTASPAGPGRRRPTRTTDALGARQLRAPAGQGGSGTGVPWTGAVRQYARHVARGTPPPPGVALRVAWAARARAFAYRGW